MIAAGLEHELAVAQDTLLSAIVMPDMPFIVLALVQHQIALQAGEDAPVSAADSSPELCILK